ncbi:MAG: hypothetical protein HY293_19175 [Planctomycetes bacterium]|nr:hypothetical protein [Planctomycetota bacterium]
MLCDECRRAEATLTLSFKAGCSARVKPLCEPCSRSRSLTIPFALNPLRSPTPKPPPPPSP